MAWRKITRRSHRYDYLTKIARQGLKTQVPTSGKSPFSRYIFSMDFDLETSIQRLLHGAQSRLANAGEWNSWKPGEQETETDRPEQLFLSYFFVMEPSKRKRLKKILAR